jgi:hypothetical protein
LTVKVFLIIKGPDDKLNKVIKSTVVPLLGARHASGIKQELLFTEVSLLSTIWLRVPLDFGFPEFNSIIID